MANADHQQHFELVQRAEKFLETPPSSDATAAATLIQDMQHHLVDLETMRKSAADKEEKRDLQEKTRSVAALIRDVQKEQKRNNKKSKIH